MSKFRKQKLYFCQLKADFFKDHPHDILASLPGGREALLLYLELLLESAGHGGHLLFSEDKPFTPELISAKFRTPMEVVNQSLALLEQLELLMWDDNREIILPQFSKYVGCKTNEAVERAERRANEARRRLEGVKETSERVWRRNDTSGREKPQGAVSDAQEKMISEVPDVDEVVKQYCTVAGAATHAKGGRPLNEDLVREWYATMLASGWKDTNNKDVTPVWRQKLAWFCYDEAKKRRDREARQAEEEAKEKAEEEAEWQRQNRLMMVESYD